jgi:hypothetical protein
MKVQESTPTMLIVDDCEADLIEIGGADPV